MCCYNVHPAQPDDERDGIFSAWVKFPYDPELLLLAFGSGSSARLWLLSTVLAAALFTTLYPVAVQRTAHDVVTNAGQVLNTTTAYQNDAVFLQAMPFAGEVRRHFKTVCQTHTGNLTHCRIRL